MWCVAVANEQGWTTILRNGTPDQVKLLAGALDVCGCDWRVMCMGAGGGRLVTRDLGGLAELDRMLEEFGGNGG